MCYVLYALHIVMISYKSTTFLIYSLYLGVDINNLFEIGLFSYSKQLHVKYDIQYTYLVQVLKRLVWKGQIEVFVIH